MQLQIVQVVTRSTVHLLVEKEEKMRITPTLRGSGTIHQAQMELEQLHTEATRLGISTTVSGKQKDPTILRKEVSRKKRKH
jgi:hypothetical protein